MLTPEDSNSLAEKPCPSCRGEVPALSESECLALKPQLHPEWRLEGCLFLEREFSFRSYRAGLEFTQQVGELAEAENHHPDVALGFRNVKVRWWTHKINGLSEADFIMAAKTDTLPDLP
jgi:4a-hydroxytetrahydrobiopterin dehydratase